MTASGMPGGPADLAGLVGFQAGSVVSRTLVKREKGTVTLFAFDAGQGLGEHTAPFDALLHALEGEAEVVLAGKAQRVKAGEALLLPANVPHALMAIRPFKMVLTMVRA